MLTKIEIDNKNLYSFDGLYDYLIKKFELIVKYVLDLLKDVNAENFYKAQSGLGKLEKIYLAFASEKPQIG